MSQELAAVELAKLIVGLRSGPPMTIQDAFELYRECLRVVREQDAAADEEANPSNIALAVLSLLHGAAEATGLSSAPKEPERTAKARKKPARRRASAR